MNAIRLLPTILILVFAIMIAGVSSLAAHPIAIPPFELSGTSWQLVKIHGRDDSTRTPDDPAKYTISFAADNRVTVRVDCNRGGGDWKSTGPGHVQFGPLALTRMMCAPGSLHNQFVRDWSRVRRYVIERGHLFLTLVPGGGTYEFEPIGGTQSSLFKRKWKLIEINGAAVDSTRAYIELDDATKRMSGDGGCNRFAGSFEIDGARLKFSQTLSTKRACIDQNIQQIENSFLGNLERVTGFEIRENQLRLNGYGRGLLTFESETSATGDVPAQGHVTGTVTSLQRIALPADAVIKVRLFDVTRRRTLIAEQIIRAEGRQVPFAFDVQYDPGRIEPSHQYVIEARIENRGRLLFVSTKSYPVITDGNSNTARILVNRAGR